MKNTDNIRSIHKTLGILAGMGPAAGAEFYRRIIAHTYAKSDSEHIRTVIFGDTGIPDRTDYILGRSNTSPQKSIKNDIDALLALGAEIIAIPCNTAHFFVNESDFNVNIVDIISEAIEFTVSKGMRKISVLSTDGTIASELYRSQANKRGVNIIYPNILQQQKITDLIYGKIKIGLKSENEIFSVCDGLFKRGCEAIIIGCTELSLIDFSKYNLQSYIYDAMDVLAMAAIQKCGYKTIGFDKKYG